MLGVPEHKGPPSGQAAGADHNREQGRAADLSAKEIRNARFVVTRGALGGMPFLRLGHMSPDPEHQQGRQNADEKYVLGMEIRH